MYIFTKKCFGTILEIGVDEKNPDKKIFDEISEKIDIFEQKYSRFIPGNFLWKLNNLKKSEIDEDFLTMIKIAQKLNSLSEGYFDITVLPFLENSGYGIEKNILENNYGMKNIEISEKNIFLKKGISIDLGGIGKGYMIDNIFSILDNFFSKFVINFGGDIRVKGEFDFFLQDPLNVEKNFAKFNLKNGALATSGGQFRKIKNGHHLINPFLGKSEDEKLIVYVHHNLASFADGFATTLFVSPLEISLKILNSIPGLEGMIILKNGQIFQTKNFVIQKI